MRNRVREERTQRGISQAEIAAALGDPVAVVIADDPEHLLGLLSRRQLTLAYTSLIESLRAPVATAPKPSPSGETAART